MWYGWIEFQSSGFNQGWGTGAIEGRVTEVMCLGMTSGCLPKVMKSWRALHPFPTRDAGCWHSLTQLEQRHYLSLSRRDTVERGEAGKRQSRQLAVITARQPFLGQRREGLFWRWPVSKVNSESGCLCNKRAPVGSHPPPWAVPPSMTLGAPHWRLEEQVEWPGEWGRGSKHHH